MQMRLILFSALSHFVFAFIIHALSFLFMCLLFLFFSSA